MEDDDGVLKFAAYIICEGQRTEAQSRGRRGAVLCAKDDGDGDVGDGHCIDNGDKNDILSR